MANSYLFTGNNSPIIEKRLKENANPCYSESPISGRWYINLDMIKRMGDGNYYNFKDIRKMEEFEGDYVLYTHISDDGYIYHESWFEEEDADPIEELKFNETEFLL